MGKIGEEYEIRERALGANSGDCGDGGPRKGTGEGFLEVSDSGRSELVAVARVENAGIFGLTACEFDKEGVRIRSFRTVEERVGFLEVSGLFPGIVREVTVHCPKVKCDSCPRRKKG